MKLVLLIISIVCFVLAVFGVPPGVNIGWAGLAFFAGAVAVPPNSP